MSQRSVEIRKSSNCNPALLRIPFSYIQRQFGYPVESIVRQINCEPVTHLGVYPDTFPHTITEYYWISTKGQESWMALGKVKNGLYFFYTADSTSTTTFKNGGARMNLWFSTRYDKLIHFAMNETIYQEYYTTTIDE